MDKREATRILKEQADYWRWLAKHNGVDGYPDHRLHTIIAGLDWAHDHMACKSQNTPDPITGLVPCGCGGKVDVAFYPGWHGVPDMYRVDCFNCHVGTRPCQTAEQAKAAWNTAMGWKGGAE